MKEKRNNKENKTGGDFVAVLHNIRSLHNVGSIFRTADGAGMRKIYLCGITSAPVDSFDKPVPQLVKTSLGAEKYVEWEKFSSAAKLIGKLKKEGYEIIAVEQDKKSVPLDKFKARKKKICLIVGNEVSGLPKPILKLADRILEIPMFGKKESLNVSVAFGIAAYHLAAGSRAKL